MSEAERIRVEYARRRRAVPLDRYAPSAPAQLLLRQARERAVLALLRGAGLLPLAGRRILDVGCGEGQWLADLETWGATRSKLAGVDLLRERVEAARARLPARRDAAGALLDPGADVREADAARLPWPDGAFDLVLQSLVFSSILDATVRRQVAAEMARVLAPDGAILWNDFVVGNPLNPSLCRVSLAELRALFPGFALRRRRCGLAPPLARALAPRLPGLVEALERLAVLDVQVVALLRRDADGAR